MLLVNSPTDRSDAETALTFDQMNGIVSHMSKAKQRTSSTAGRESPAPAPVLGRRIVLIKGTGIRISESRAGADRPRPAADRAGGFAQALPLHSAIVAGGTDVAQIGHLAAHLELTEDVLALRCGLSRPTFHRRKQAKATLSATESDLLARHALLLQQAVDVFEDEAAARDWLKAPQPGLSDQVPLDLVLSTAGYREVEKLLTRIDVGAYA